MKTSATLRRESALFVFATGAVALHIVDDNFLQPARGTSPSHHLASGLVPLAVLALVTAIYSHLPAGARAATAMTVGAIAITLGVPGLYYLLDGTASADHYTGLLAIAAGAVVLVSAPVILWTARRGGGSRRSRYLHRAFTAGVAALLTLASVWFLIFPIGFAYIYTHTGRGR